MPENRSIDPQLMWQGQTREHPVMSVEEIRVRALVVQGRIRRNLILGFASEFLLLILCSIFIANTSSFLAAVAGAVMALTVVIAYQAYSRMWFPNILSPNTALKGCLDFYRRELEAQHRSISLTWRSLGPLVVFAYLTWNIVLRTPSVFPKILLPSVLVLVLFLRRRELRKLKHKLSLLDEFEKEH